MKIQLTDYDAEWAHLYEAETHLQEHILGSEIIRFEHFGSTSVPGLKAKPVIDMMCIVRDIHQIDKYEAKLRTHGYDAAGESGISGRRLFRKGGEQRTHHLHVYQFDNPHILRHLVVRDYLRCHPVEVQQYGRLKEELAKHYDDTSYYSQAKKPFVQRLEQRAMEWYEIRRGAEVKVEGDTN